MARCTTQPNGGGGRETDCEEPAPMERRARVKEPEEATESIALIRQYPLQFRLAVSLRSVPITCLPTVGHPPAVGFW